MVEFERTFKNISLVPWAPLSGSLERLFKGRRNVVTPSDSFSLNFNVNNNTGNAISQQLPWKFNATALRTFVLRRPSLGSLITQSSLAFNQDESTAPLYLSHYLHETLIGAFSSEASTIFLLIVHCYLDQEHCRLNNHNEPSSNLRRVMLNHKEDFSVASSDTTLYTSASEK